MGWSLEDGRRQSWCKKMKKENRQIELQWITLIAGRESITRLGVHAKSWWSLLGEQVEVRNILSWTRQGWPHLSVLRVSLKWKVSSHEQLLKIWEERLDWKKASCSLFVTLVFIKIWGFRWKVMIFSPGLFCLWVGLPLQKGELLLPDPAKRAELHLLSRWKLEEYHKDGYKF